MKRLSKAHTWGGRISVVALAVGLAGSSRKYRVFHSYSGRESLGIFSSCLSNSRTAKVKRKNSVIRLRGLSVTTSGTQKGS